MTLTLDIARILIRAILDESARAGMKPLSVCVVDAGGFPVAFERSDGTAPMRFKIAHGKASGAARMGIGSRALFERAQAQPYFIQAVNSLSDGALVPVPGGVLIKSGGTIIGAVGVTGDTSDNDEAVAVAAITAAGFEADTGASA